MARDRLSEQHVSHGERNVSPRGKELIRRATTLLMNDPEGLFSAVDEAVLAAQPPAILADPELIDAIRASNRSNLTRWATVNLAAPGVPVPANRAEETLGLARLIARRGIEDTSRVSYSAGQNAAWTVWMKAVFRVSSDAAELQEVLEASAVSAFEFVERTLALLREEIDRERGQVLSSDNARRLALINQILAGETSAQLTQELRYAADLYEQTAAVLTLHNGSERLLATVERLAAAVRPRLRRQPLTVVADADTVWAWFPSDSLEETLVPDLEEAARALSSGDRLGDARVAIGTTRPGFSGFRESHAEALAAAAVANAEVVTYESVALAALVRAEPERVRDYVFTRVGRLDREAKQTLRAYLQNRCSPSKTAAATFTHRNTVIDRIRRAESYLPFPIAGHELELAVALELDRFSWRVPPGAWP